MPNTGYKKYNYLIEVDATTGIPTGNSKPNSPMYPEYIPPVYDNLVCPLPTTTTTTEPPTTTTTTTEPPTTTTTSTSTTTTTTVDPTLRQFAGMNYLDVFTSSLFTLELEDVGTTTNLSTISNLDYPNSDIQTFTSTGGTYQVDITVSGPSPNCTIYIYIDGSIHSFNDYLGLTTTSVGPLPEPTSSIDIYIFPYGFRE